MKRANLSDFVWQGKNFILYRGYVLYRENQDSGYRKYSYGDILFSMLTTSPQYEICEWLFSFKGVAIAIVGFAIVNMAISGAAAFLYLLVIALIIFLGYKFRIFCVSISFKDKASVTETVFSGDREKFKDKWDSITDALYRRRNALDLNLVMLDLNSLLETPEHDKSVEFEEDEIKFIDYFYHLDSKVAGIFDIVRVRIFGERKYFSQNVITHLNFSISNPDDRVSIVMGIADLIRFFGKPNTGEEKLSKSEESQLIHGTLWSGRQWSFNKAHQLFNISSQPHDEMSYMVMLDAVQNGVELDIADYHNLVRDFG